MKAIFDALNIIYDEDEKRGLIWLNVVSLFFTVCAIAAVGMSRRNSSMMFAGRPVPSAVRRPARRSGALRRCGLKRGSRDEQAHSSCG